MKSIIDSGGKRRWFLSPAPVSSFSLSPANIDARFFRVFVTRVNGGQSYEWLSRNVPKQSYREEQMSSTSNTASFVAITRLVDGRIELLVEYDSPKHNQYYHAIGGKQLPGEDSHDAINRELAEECELPLGGVPFVRRAWLELDDSNLMGRIHHPEYHSSSPMEFNTFYLYPVEEKNVYSKDVKVAWVPLGDLTPMNSTCALDDLVMFLKGSIKRRNVKRPIYK